MKPHDFIRVMQQKVAVSAVGLSTVRGQGRGVLSASQNFLGHISLTRIPNSNEKRFRIWLTRNSEYLLDYLPVKNRPWGTARKVINIFLRDSLYNQYLCRRFHLQAIERWLEVPLDSVVARALKQRGVRGELPPWPGLKRLTPEVSDKFQDFASQIAQQKGFARVHLDIFLWLKNR
jgi:hypothetical protein